MARLISDVLPFGCLWHVERNAINHVISYAKFRSRSHEAVIHIYDAAGKVIETHKHGGDLKEPSSFLFASRRTSR